MSLDLNFAWETMKQILTKGLPVSLELLALTVVISFPLGFLCAIVRYKKVKVIDQIMMVIMSFFKGTPLIVLIFIFYDALPGVLNEMGTRFGWTINFFHINEMAYAVAVCCSFEIAICCETFRASLQAVGRDQMEAAHSVGMNSFQAYIHVIIPQAIVNALPNLGNEVVNLFKGTSLIFYMGIQDIMGVAKANAGTSYKYLEAYLDVFLIYVVLCYILQEVMLLLEKKAGKFAAVKS